MPTTAANVPIARPLASSPCCSAKSRNSDASDDWYSSISPVSAARRCASPLDAYQTSCLGSSFSATTCANASDGSLNVILTAIPLSARNARAIASHHATLTLHSTFTSSCALATPAASMSAPSAAHCKARRRQDGFRFATERPRIGSSRVDPHSERDDPALAQRLLDRHRDPRRLGRIAQRQRRRAVFEHRLHEFDVLAQERLFEAIVERRRALMTNAVLVADHYVIEAALAADGDPSFGPDHFSEALEAVRHRPRRVDRRDLARRELARRNAVVDVL